MKIYRISKADYSDFDRLIESYSHLNKYGFQTAILGRTYEDYPIYLICPKVLKSNLPCVMIGTGAHGEEKAGPWGLASYVEKMPLDILNHVNLSFLPDINPTGLVHETRYNIENEVTNSVIDEENPNRFKGLSKETKIIVQHKDLIKKLSKDLFITLHENNGLETFYLYAMCYDKEHYGISNDLVTRLKEIMSKYYTCRADGAYEETQLEDAYEIKNGVVSNFHDGTLEDFIVRTMKNPISISTETPVEGTTVQQRIKTNALIVNEVVNYFASR